MGKEKYGNSHKKDLEWNGEVKIISLEQRNRAFDGFYRIRYKEKIKPEQEFSNKTSSESSLV